MTAAWLRSGAVVLLSFGLMACGDSGGGEGSGGSGGGTGATGGSGGGGSGGTGTGGSGAGGSGGGDCAAPSCGGCADCWHEQLCLGVAHDDAVDACIDNPQNLQVVKITTDAFVVGAGEEVYRCQNFANPVGSDVEVQRTESYMTPGSHHMFAFYREGAQNGSVEPCSGLEFDRALHTAQTPYNQFDYPAGVAAQLFASEGIRIAAHYLNTTGSELTAKVTTVLYLAKAGTVQQHAAQIFFNNLQILVPPNSPGSAEMTCTLPKDISLFAVTSHMHQFGTHFVASTGSGTPLFETQTWDDPEFKIFDPALALPQGETITFRCEYENPTSNALFFGEKAETNEMCILSGRYFPAPDGATLGCN